MSSRVENIDERISELCALGDELAAKEDFEGALKLFQQALELIPAPADSHPAALWVCTAIGDMYFHLGRHREGRDALRSAVRLPDGLGNPFVHLRLGQCEFELGSRERAADELARAYMGGGDEIFEEDDEKYLRFVKSLLLPPQDA
ncbi:tetratricopeptide repeat protein [Pyxidicoccus fallax]|uniref:Tetratricopeptide repeat protein n=1 Tax=Pyxidicoccus fallax TaxID=394095 RepID=A0A848M0R2_9BACT|nr:tetratricopeptide repeat protein [Pyxidicoccus fallax]NMO23459.1 tetratricopeptide repeat protein [Pyxidicoccus fallax]NPC86651.1 tetratricopeptide repeat protein [Pyxidicoccus fallax]